MEIEAIQNGASARNMRYTIYKYTGGCSGGQPGPPGRLGPPSWLGGWSSRPAGRPDSHPDGQAERQPKLAQNTEWVEVQK